MTETYEDILWQHMTLLRNNLAMQIYGVLSGEVPVEFILDFMYYFMEEPGGNYTLEELAKKCGRRYDEHTEEFGES